VRRVQFIELHEQSWFPAPLRDQVTDALQRGMHFLNAYTSVASLVQGVLDATGGHSIVDICSGAGGPWAALSRILKGNGRGIQIQLTDKYPNLKAFEKIAAASEGHITFRADSVDASNVPRELRGLRTMFSTFHHFPPGMAAAVLQNAVSARQSVAIFEITRRAPSAIGWMFPWALLAFVYTPKIRPFRWSRLLWTYVIPLIPFVVLFDGVVSCLRTYRPQELQEIIGRLKQADYEWQAGEYSSTAARMPITYLIGCPRKSSRIISERAT
jgi:hypothetical protein